MVAQVRFRFLVTHTTNSITTLSGIGNEKAIFAEWQKFKNNFAATSYLFQEPWVSEAKIKFTRDSSEFPYTESKIADK